MDIDYSDNNFTETYDKMMRSDSYSNEEYEAEQEMENMSMFVEPLLHYPDQYILVCTANRSLMLFSERTKQFLSDRVCSKGDLWKALGTLTPQADILTQHILQSLVQTGNTTSASPFSIIFLNARYTVELQYITGMDMSRNLIISLIPEMRFNSVPDPSSTASRTASSSAFGSYVAQMQDSALNYNLKLKDYVNNCQNDDIYYHTTTRDSKNDTTLSWESGRRGSQIREFIPNMLRPEVNSFIDLVKNEPPVSVKVSMDSYYHDPVDPDIIPPSFCVNNTSNTGDAGAQIARKSNHNQVNSGDKRCHACGTEKSPEWRRGPVGPKTLCNACGLRYAKQLRAGNA